ncbi:NLR family CARD domain-containing protein 4-like isoform X3 [Apostichopus japonicus]|uniref:NLR family CARD domain-containing protein 4-like isoform X3 n=1 Tax=Stichopus japonicus TaxID=307972 RepID=UPI003AB4DB0F
MAANVNPVDIKPDLKKAVNGFGSFKVALATVLTVKIVLELATFFEYPPVVIEELSNAAASAGLLMIRYMEERGQIEPTSIMTLLCALKKMCLSGIEMSARKLYEEHTGRLCSSDDHSKAQLEGKKNDLIKYAKTAYRKHYETAKPFPSMNKCKVNTIFVQGGIYCSALEGDFMQKPDVLESYNDILSSSKTKSKRTLIEADPGFGKSTLASQFVYDWCTNNPESPLKDVEILIFLQLRQLTGVQSIYTAIKNSIVPKDEDMDEACIKEILKVYKKSVVMLFDSYDEYPDKNETETDIFSIIEMKMFLDILVIILTRTLILPPNLHPETKRIRLTGFGVAERRNYVLKAVADDVQLADRIEEQLQRNPFLRDLCQVPLFSTMVAHIAHERPEIEIFSTVTRFFTYVIACVHNHMKIKKDANTEVPAFENELAKLYRIAFDGLTRKNQQLAWENTYLVSELGQEFYDNYIKLGMFAQEVVFDISQCRYKTEARIWHKIICELYASHHLVSILSEGASSAAPSINVQETLNSINPLDLQYVYRFACGLNKSAADIIIKHLQETKEGRQFAILCVLEQEENSDQFRQSVKDLVSRDVEIFFYHAKLLQRSTIQVLEVASANQVIINLCIDTLNTPEQVLKLKKFTHLGLLYLIFVTHLCYTHCLDLYYNSLLQLTVQLFSFLLIWVLIFLLIVDRQ